MSSQQQNKTIDSFTQPELNKPKTPETPWYLT
uniref:Uncharacterized protein n=1 Tax=Arundo donax TaxID=35708 RepID=A0A0A9BYS2_ARUDO